MRQEKLDAYESSVEPAEDTEITCPTCGKQYSSEKGMKIHHAKEHGESISGAETDCPTCGTTFRVKPYKLDECKDGPFCSRDCSFKDKERPVDLICQHCEEQFTVPARHGDRQYCSHECWIEYNQGENHYGYGSVWGASLNPDEADFVSGEEHPCWEGGLEEVDCTWCDSTIEKKPSLVNDDLNFCDKQCESEWKSDGNMSKENHPCWKGGDTTAICKECGSEFTTNRRTRAIRKYCSFDCKGAAQSRDQHGSGNPAWNGGRDFYTRIRASLSDASWERIAEETRDRYEHRCQTCGVHQSDIGRKLDVHHVIAVMAGGTNGEYNLMPFCPSCHKTAESFSKQFNPLLLAE